MTAYVAYLRVSTSKQEKSGLGLAAQRSALQNFLAEDDQLIAEFVETHSGRKDDRAELSKALALAKRMQAKLLIAKLDRFSRKVSFISRLMDDGVGLVVAEMPNATDFQLHIFAALAQEERRLISVRTKAALAEAKSRGVVLGANAKRLAKLHRSNADDYALGIRDQLEPMLKIGMSYRAIANELNRSSTKSFRGGVFHPQTVVNLATRLRNLSLREQ